MDALKLTFVVLLLFFVSGVYGQPKKYKIDIELDRCLDSPKGYSTSGMIECTNNAILMWDKELNKVYKKLTTLLTKDQLEKLRTSQRKWIAFRDKELEFSNQFYTDMGGTMWTIATVGRKLDLTRQRTVELKTYITNLADEE